MKDPKTEQFLSHGAWKWKYHDRIPFSEIDLKASRENPSRLLGRLDDERVMNYGLAMQDGAKFPAIVLLALDPAVTAFKYQIATGCHRQAACELCSGVDGCDAYVVTEPDQYRAELLVRQLNTIEGYGVSPRDQVLQVLHLHETYPDKSLKALAKEWNLKESTVKHVAAEQQAYKRARGFGFDFSKNSKIPKSLVVSMNGIHSDFGFQRVAAFVAQHNVTTAEAEDLVKDVKKAASDSAAAQVVETHIKALDSRKTKDKAKHGRITQTNSGKFFQQARTLNNLLDKGIEKLHFTAHPRRDLVAILAQDLIENLKRVIADIERIERIEHPVRRDSTQPGAGLH